MSNNDSLETIETGNGGYNPYTLIPKAAFTVSDMALGRLGTQSYVRLGNAWTVVNIATNMADGNPEEVNKIIISRAVAVGVTVLSAPTGAFAPFIGLTAGAVVDKVLHQTPTQDEVIQGLGETYNYSSAVESALQEIVRASQANNTAASQDASAPPSLSASAFARQVVSVRPDPNYQGEENGYTVQKGDNLTRIAEANGLTPEELIKANTQITHPNLIHPGQVINVPGYTPPGKGDTGSMDDGSPMAPPSGTDEDPSAAVPVTPDPEAQALTLASILEGIRGEASIITDGGGYIAVLDAETGTAIRIAADGSLAEQPVQEYLDALSKTDSVVSSEGEPLIYQDYENGTVTLRYDDGSTVMTDGTVTEWNYADGRTLSHLMDQDIWVDRSTDGSATFLLGNGEERTFTAEQFQSVNPETFREILSEQDQGSSLVDIYPSEDNTVTFTFDNGKTYAVHSDSSYDYTRQDGNGDIVSGHVNADGSWKEQVSTADGTPVSSQAVNTDGSWTANTYDPNGYLIRQETTDKDGNVTDTTYDAQEAAARAAYEQALKDTAPIGYAAILGEALANGDGLNFKKSRMVLHDTY